MGFLNTDNQPKRINNIRVTQSTQGYPLPAAMGQVRMHQSLIWMGSLVEVEESGGKGGGKSGQFYLYYADVIGALCNGEVTGIGSVWSGQTWLSSQGTDESTVIQQNYSPSNAVTLVLDNGAALVTTYDNTYTDFGQPASTVLSGSDLSPMQKIIWFVLGSSYTAGTQVFNGTDIYNCIKGNTNEPLSDATYWTNTGAGLSTGQYSLSTESVATFVLSAAGTAAGGSTVYTGTITGGGSNFYAGYTFVVVDFDNPNNNGTFLCSASTSASLTLNNANGVAETQTASAADQGNTYHFSTSDVGKSAAIWYQFNYSLVNQQTIAIIPSGVAIPDFPAQTIVVNTQYTPTFDLGVEYYGEFSDKSGQPLTPVSTTPTETGTYQVFLAQNIGNEYVTYYVFAPGDISEEVLITFGITNQSAVGQGAPELINFELFGGGQSQAPWQFLITGGTAGFGSDAQGQTEVTMPGNPGQSLGYTGIAYIGYGPMFLGDSAEVQDNTFEIITPDAYGGGYSAGTQDAGSAVVDCNPVTCILQVLTNPMWGLGGPPVPFPVDCIDNSSLGTWGGPVGTPGNRQLGSTAWNWFAANGFFISPKIDSQDTASSVMGKWLEAGQCAAFMSEGLLKLVPYGSTSVAGQGCTWIGPQDFIVALDDSCFMAEDGQDPVKITRSSWQDGYNKVQVQWENRKNQYADEITQEFDQASINRWGERLEPPQSYDFVHTLTAATFAASMRVKRMVNIRNTYEFVLPFTYSYLEPMDIVTITTSSIWAAGLNNVNLAILNLPVRITKIEDDPTKGLKINAEDYQALTLEPVLYNKGISSGNTLVNAFAQPGDTIAILFEATSELTNHQGNQVWIGAVGASSEWGGCNVWVSQDNSKYLQIGTIKQSSRLGLLSSYFPEGVDPDTVDSLIVDLEPNCLPLDAGTETDADYGNTMCFCDGELIAYSAVEVTGASEYTMDTYIRRGLLGSQNTPHNPGTAFMRLDDTIFKYTYNPQWAGQTLYFKFQSMNNYGGNPQLLSSLTPVAFIVPGLGPGTIDAGSGLIIADSSFNVGAGPFTGPPVAIT